MHGPHHVLDIFQLRRDPTLERLQDFRLARWDSNPLPFVEHGANEL